jgi:hypothetical protein
MRLIAALVLVLICTCSAQQWTYGTGEIDQSIFLSLCCVYLDACCIVRLHLFFCLLLLFTLSFFLSFRLSFLPLFPLFFLPFSVLPPGLYSARQHIASVFFNNSMYLVGANTAEVWKANGSVSLCLSVCLCCLLSAVSVCLLFCVLCRVSALLCLIVSVFSHILLFLSLSLSVSVCRVSRSGRRSGKR